MAETTIEWTITIDPDGRVHKGFTFNPWVGCTKLSAACDNCYAEGWARRAGDPELWQGERRRTTPDYWKQPLKWNRLAKSLGVRLKVFCASLADVFDNQVPEEWRHDLWALIAATPNLNWLLLTKRPQNIAKMLPADWAAGYPNVWLGTTVENQAEADRRIPHLLKVSAPVHFLSCEPLLGALDIGWAISRNRLEIGAGLLRRGHFSPGLETLKRLSWVITGGESGGNARPAHPDWIRDIRDQCEAAGVAFLFKQWGEWAPGENVQQDIAGTRRDATWWDNRWSFGETRMSDPEDKWMDEPDLYRIGKKAAGRKLDGRTWDQFPAEAA